MLNIQNAEEFLEVFTEWAEEQEEILGALLVGSYARNEAKPGSDIDLVIVTNKPEIYLEDNNWVKEFGKVKAIIREDYKAVQIKRALYSNGLEVEFGVTTSDWAEVDLIDKGTERVIEDGARILLDKGRILEKLLKNI